MSRRRRGNPAEQNTQKEPNGQKPDNMTPVERLTSEGLFMFVFHDGHLLKVFACSPFAVQRFTTLMSVHRPWFPTPHFHLILPAFRYPHLPSVLRLLISVLLLENVSNHDGQKQVHQHRPENNETRNFLKIIVEIVDNGAVVNRHFFSEIITRVFRMLSIVII